MDRRLQKGDLLAVIGLLLVLVWTPSYLAADPVERSLADGETFQPADPRPGDRIVQDVVVTDKDGHQYVLEGACVIEFREPEAGESPVAALLVEERTWRAFDVRLGPIHLLFSGVTQRTFFAEDGTVAWVALDQPATGDGRALSTATRPLYPHEEANALAGHEVRYTASDVQAGMIGLSDAIKERVHFALSEDTLKRETSSDAAVAATYKGNIVVGNGGTDRLATKVDETLRKTASGRLLGADEDSFAWYVHRVWRATFGDNDLPEGGRFWTWFNPDAPIPVGGHASYTRGAAEGVQIDIVPGLIERGDGPSLKLASGSPWASHRSSPVSEIPDPSHRLPAREVERLRLPTLEADPTRLYRGYTLAMVKDMLVRSDPPPSIDSALDQDARVVAFAWELAPARIVATTTGGPIPPLVGESPATTTEWRSNWTLVLARPDADPVVAKLFVGERGDGTWVLRSVDVCATDPDSCPDHGSVPVDLQRLVVAPAAVLDAMRSHHGDFSYAGWPARLRFDPTFVQVPDGSTGLPAWSSHSYLPGSCVRNAWVNGGYLHIEGALIPAGIACWDDEAAKRKAGSVDLDDGHLVALMTIEGRPDGGPASTGTVSAAVEAVRLLDVPAPTLATGGILLVLASLALRIGGWLKVGGHLPAVATLYAKIAKSDVLDHTRRSEVHEVVRADPGVTARELADRTGHAWGVIVHHLTTLQRNGLVTSLTVGNRRSYFVPDETDAATRRLLAAARNPDDGAMLQALRKNPGVTVSELADLLGRKSPSISRAGKRLVGLGVVRKERDGMKVRYFMADAGSQAGS